MHWCSCRVDLYIFLKFHITEHMLGNLRIRQSVMYYSRNLIFIMIRLNLILNFQLIPKLAKSPFFQLIIESFFRYWERSDGRLLENNEKYRIEYIGQRDPYRSTMRLNITRTTAYDFNFIYFCISKNELQTTKGEITLFGRRGGCFVLLILE